MYIFENGAYRQMTAEEFEAFWAEREAPPETERGQTIEERMTELENRLNAIEYPDFVQPTGAQNAYAKGAKVTYNGKRYVSIYDGANVWTPDAYPDGWSEVS